MVLCYGRAIGRCGEDGADGFQGRREGERRGWRGRGGVRGWEVSAAGCVDWVRGEGYDSGIWGQGIWWVGLYRSCACGYWSAQSLVCEKTGGEDLLEMGDPGEGGDVGEMNVCKLHRWRYRGGFVLAVELRRSLDAIESG
jgi:hypothetical protein